MSQDEKASLSERTGRAAVWMVGGKLFSKVIDFITLLILARILGPSEFGLVAVAMTAVFIVEAILELPLASALIRVPEPTNEMFETAFTLGLLRGVLIALILGAASLAMAEFYGDPRLVELICALAIAPIMRGLISPRMILFAKRFDFRPDFALEISGKLSAFALATFVALQTESYWAIAIGTITTPTVMMLISYIIAPQRVRFNLSEWPVFSDIMRWNTVSQFIMALNWQMDTILLGRYLDQTSIGRYSAAKDLAAVPFQAIIQPLNKPLVVAFSSLENDESRCAAYCKASTILVILIVPVMLSISIFSTTIVRVLLGSEWLQSAEILQWISLIAAAGIIITPATPLAMVINGTRFIAIRSGVGFIIKLPLMIGLVHFFGIYGALAAQAITASIIMLFSMWTVYKLIGLTIYRQTIAIWRPLISLAPLSFLLTEGESFLNKINLGKLELLAAPLIFLASYFIYILIILGAWKLGGSKDGAEKLLAEKLKKIIFKLYFRTFKSAKT